MAGEDEGRGQVPVVRGAAGCRGVLRQVRGEAGRGCAGEGRLQGVAAGRTGAQARGLEAGGAEFPVRIEQVHDDPPRYSAWIAPTKTYRLVCCGCGLKHDLQFEARAKGERVDLRGLTIRLRARRVKR